MLNKEADMSLSHSLVAGCLVFEWS